MSLPKKLRIGSMTYDIKEVKDLKTPWGQNAYGCHTFHKRLIEIDKEPDESVKLLYVLHEVLHGLFNSQEIDIDAEKEEEVVTKLTHGVASFIKDNPDYIKQLIKR